MTTQVLVDFNTRDAQGYVPAHVGTLNQVPAVGADRRGRRRGQPFIARVAGIVGSVIALAPEWRTFVEPSDSKPAPSTRQRSRIREMMTGD